MMRTTACRKVPYVPQSVGNGVDISRSWPELELNIVIRLVHVNFGKFTNMWYLLVQYQSFGLYLIYR